MLIGNALMSLFITLVGALIAHWIFKHFATDKAARIAAFWLTVGGTAPRYSLAGPWSPELALALGKLAGTALALAILWWWLLRRRPAHEG